MNLLARTVAHLYVIAGTLAARHTWDAADRAAELVRVLEMLKCAYEQLAPLPDCAASVLEQYVIVRSVQASALDDVQAAMALTRAGLVLNTWCTAPSLLPSIQATDSPLSIGGLVQTLGPWQSDPRYQATVAEQLATVAYDNSAARQLGACYFQAHEAYSLLELHNLLGTSDTSHAAALLDNASRGALTALRFLERAPLDQADAGADARADTLAEVDDRDHRLATEAKADDRDGALANDRDHRLATEAEVTDRDSLAGARMGETDKPNNSPSMAARGPPPCPGIIQARSRGKPDRLAQLIETPAAGPGPWSGQARDAGDAALAREAIGARLNQHGMDPVSAGAFSNSL